jgi:predicted transcriptional regulator
VPEPKRRTRAKTGKRSDEAYTNVGLLLPEALKRRLKARAALEGRDMSTLAEEAIAKYLAATEPTTER